MVRYPVFFEIWWFWNSMWIFSPFISKATMSNSQIKLTFQFSCISSESSEAKWRAERMAWQLATAMLSNIGSCFILIGNPSVAIRITSRETKKCVKFFFSPVLKFSNKIIVRSYLLMLLVSSFGIYSNDLKFSVYFDKQCSQFWKTTSFLSLDSDKHSILNTYRANVL